MLNMDKLFKSWVLFSMVPYWEVMRVLEEMLAVVVAPITGLDSRLLLWFLLPHRLLS